MTSLEKIHCRIFNLGLAVLSILALAGLGSAAYRFYGASSPDQEEAASTPRPAPPRPSSLQDYQIITRHNLFDPAGRGSGLSSLSRLLAKAEPAPSSKRTDLVLLGTVVSDQDSFAMIRTGGKAEIFHVKENIPGVGRVEKVLRKQVMIRETDGKPLLLEIATSAPAPSSAPASGAGPSFPPFPGFPLGQKDLRNPGITPLGGNRWRLSSQAAEKAGVEFIQVFAEMPPRPSEKGESAELTLRRLHPFSILRQLGLQSGDRIEEINGTAVENPEQAVQALAEGGGIVLGVLRRGKKMTLEFQVE